MAQTKILVLSPLPEALIETLFKIRAGEQEIEDLKIVTYAGSTREDLLEAVSDADVIIGDYTNNIEMDAGIIKASSKCILIQQPSTGFQHIDVEEAARRQIPVANIAGANTFAVAEHTIMLILGCLKKVILSHEKTKNALWAQDEMANYGVFELWDKTLGIIGAGRIGKEVARRALPFGPRLIYYDVNRLPSEQEEDLRMSYRPLDDLVAESDVITIHAPLTPETENMMSAERISMMKPNAVLVNVSRGAMVDEEALARALEEGRIQGAGLDVYSREPVNPENPLLRAPNTILTPHTAGATNESRLRIINLSMDNVAGVLAGREPVNIVNGVEPRFER